MTHLTLLLAGGGISRPFLWAKNEPGPYDEDWYWRQSGISGRPRGQSAGIWGLHDRYWIIKLVDKRWNRNVRYEDVETRIKDILKSKRIQQFREEFNRELLDDAQIVIETNPQ